MWSLCNPSVNAFPHRFRAHGWSAGWQGFVYCAGYSAGEASVSVLLEAVAKDGIKAVAHRARGTFWLCLEAPDGTTYHLVDPCGIMRVYLSPKGLFGSYMAALKSIGAKLGSCSPEGVVEFLNYGRFGANYTHHPEVVSLRGTDVAAVDEQGHLSLLDRGLEDPVIHPGEDTLTVFRDLATALKGQRVSVDLTGGMDSRLIVALLHAEGLQFETGLSGAAHYTEFAQAQAVADRLKRVLNRFGHPLETLDSDLRRAAFRNEGLLDVVGSHRPTLMQEARAAHGVEVVVGGMGGEMINDFTFFQDPLGVFRKQAKMECFLDLRLLPVTLPAQLLSLAYREAQMGLRERMLSRLQSYRRESATSTYLHVFYAHRMNASAGAAFTANLKAGIAHLAPLMDYELYAGTYQMPLSERFASRHHRRLIAERTPEIAGLPSSTGMRASAGWVGELEDVARFGLRFAGRALRKVDQRLMGRPLRVESPNNPELYSVLRGGKLIAESIDYLKDQGVLEPTISLDQLPNPWLGKVIALALFGQQLES